MLSDVNLKGKISTEVLSLAVRFLFLILIG